MENEFDQLDLNDSILELSDDEFESAFKKTPSAEELKGGKKDPDEEEEKPKKDEKKKPAEKIETPQQTDDDDIPVVDDEDDDDDDDEDEKKAAKEKKPKDKAEVPSDVDQDVQVKAIKAHVDFLVENGIWAEFEGREDVEWTDETFAEITLQQDKYRLQQQLNEELESTGYYGKAIINYTRNGGNPEKLIDIFKTQQAFKEFDITTPEGQKDQIRMYYTEVLNWDKARVDKHINRLELDEELEVESKHIDGHYSKQIKQTVEKEQKRQAELKRQQEEENEAFTSSVAEVINSREDLDAAEKKRLLSQFTTYKQIGETKVNQMYLNFEKVQKDPESFVLLLEFLDNPKKYNQKKESKGAKEANVKRIKFLQANGTDNKKASSQAKVTRVKSSGGELDGWG